jgi:hypothetical protein
MKTDPLPDVGEVAVNVIAFGAVAFSITIGVAAAPMLPADSVIEGLLSPGKVPDCDMLPELPAPSVANVDAVIRKLPRLILPLVAVV